MSTKIYNGYILPPLSLKELTEFCHKVRDQLKAKKTELLKDFYTKEMIYNLDCHALELIEKKPTFVNLKMELSKRVNDIYFTGYRDPLIDFESQAVFFPFADKILATFYAERKEMKEVWESFPEVKKYGYWNNTDKPEHLSEAEWENRSKEWDQAFSKFPPSQSGLSFNFTNQDVWVLDALDSVITDQANKESRIKTMTNVLLERHYWKLRESDFEEASKDKSTIETFRIIREFKEYQKTDEAKGKAQELEKEVLAKLKDRYERNDLF